MPRPALVGALGAVVALGGCRCGAAPEPSPEVPHFLGWDALVEAAWRGRTDKATLYATDLSGGPPTEGVDGAAAEGDATVAGALGFVRFAQDPADLAEAVSTAARGCGTCHDALAAPAPPRPVWAHETGAKWAVDTLVWTRPGSPPQAEVPEEITTAWNEPVPDDAPHGREAARVARLLVACAGCHAPGDLP